MMTDPTEDKPNVITHARFQGRADAAPPSEQTVRGIESRVGFLSELDSLGLPDVAYGETVLGTLEPEEIGLFIDYHRAHKELDTLQRKLGGEYFKNMGQAIEQGQEAEFMQGGNPGMTEADAAQLFRLSRKVEYLKGMVYWRICERLGHHDWFVSVRTKGRIVAICRKW